MKAVMVMFDSLNRRMLPTYGCDSIHAPNFTRLQNRSVVFDNCFVGSMPCMPARRELHTGRYNFLHRAWGPLEPFDDSMPRLLRDEGIYTHLITDHYHYWEDGGATYHTQYNSWESVRGQEGDPWKGHVGGPEMPEHRIGRNIYYTPHWYVNKQYLVDKPTVEQTFDLGLEFMERNRSEDNWFLHIESFDPHEPFTASEQYRQLYPEDYHGPEFDWPDYKRVTESPDEIQHARNLYSASLSQCDAQLGRVLDFMDRHDMWQDTLLIVCTDHGFLLGEHGWWAKNRAPYYNEVAHTPLYIWDPRLGLQGERRSSLVQIIDLMPTMLDFFGVDIPDDVRGQVLTPVLTQDEPVHEAVLYGLHAAHVCCTDGDYTYMRAPATAANQPATTYTLMPTTNSSFLTHRELETGELVGPLPFTKGLKVLKMTFFGRPKGIGIDIESYAQGTMLFNHRDDPNQLRPLDNPEAEERIIRKMIAAMRLHDSPPEQFERLGLTEYI